LFIKEPTYLGDDFKNPGKIELIRGVPGGKGLLVAIHRAGRVRQILRCQQSKIDRRRQNGKVLNTGRKI